jgi:hypothetical protein
MGNMKEQTTWENLGVHKIVILKEVECENVDCFDLVEDRM